jgi:hypothetical protein
MVEDENPPAYDPVPLAAEAAEDAAPAETAGAAAAPNKITDGKPKTVTSSFRSINRLLYANGGWRANFRGLFCLLAQRIATSFLYGIFYAILPGVFASVGSLLAALSLVQLSAAWVHIVISQRSPLHFWQRLPPFKRAFNATAKPTVLYWLAVEMTNWVAVVVAIALRFHYNPVGLDRDGKPIVPRYDANDVWKSVVIIIVTLVCQVFLIIPARVVLTRVQASLLPDEDETIIPFDRSFESKVEPAIVGGTGYVSMRDAWLTFSRAAWKRLIILYIKIFVVCFGLFALMSAVVVPEVIIMAKKSTRKN